MARSDLILNLARAGSQGDQLGVRRTLEAMVADERDKQHHVIAEQLSAEGLIAHRGEGGHGHGVECVSSLVKRLQGRSPIAHLHRADASDARFVVIRKGTCSRHCSESSPAALRSESS